MASRKDIELYIPGEQTATLYFTKQGPEDPETGKPSEITVMWMDVKADLTFDDRKKLFWEADELENETDANGDVILDADGAPKKKPLENEQVWERLAPFVLDWSVGRKDAKGKAVKVDPPAVAGGKQFDLISDVYVRELLRELRFRSTGKVSTDFLAR